MAPKKAPVTSSRTRQERIKNRGKAPASTPKPRQTAAGNRGAQKGPLKPGTRTSGTPMVNSSSPAMRQIQAKASELRSQVDKGVRAARQTATSLPNSVRTGQNLVRQGAQNMRQAAAGTMSSAQRTMLQAQGAAAKAAAQAKRGAKAAMSNMSNTLANKGSVRPGRAVGSLKGGLAGAAIEQVASRTLGPLAEKAGTALGKGPLTTLGRAIDNRLPGINSKDELKRKTAASKAANAKGPKAGPSPKATVTAFSKKTFDQAFKAARTAKAKTFTWRGNKYNTKLRGEK
jgi:hypothetical protein